MDKFEICWKICTLLAYKLSQELKLYCIKIELEMKRWVWKHHLVSKLCEIDSMAKLAQNSDVMPSESPNKKDRYDGLILHWKYKRVLFGNRCIMRDERLIG